MSDQVNPLARAFAFEGVTVRCLGTFDAPEWVASDVADALGLKSNTARAIAGIPEDEKGVHGVNTPGGRQEVATLTEPGLYRLIFRSNAERSERFRRWVFHEVLPEIRKTGRYEVPSGGVSGGMTEEHVIITKLSDINRDMARYFAAGLAKRKHQRDLDNALTFTHERNQVLLFGESSRAKPVLPPVKPRYGYALPKLTPKEAELMLASLPRGQWFSAARALEVERAAVSPLYQFLESHGVRDGVGFGNLLRHWRSLAVGGLVLTSKPGRSSARWKVEAVTAAAPGSN